MTDLNKPMTLDELVELYDLNKSTVLQQFPRTQKSIEKKYGVTVEKVGRGANARYIVKNVEYVDPTRALTLYDSKENNLIPIQSAAGLLDLHFLIFVAIVSTPLRAFRGSYIDLLNYIEIEPSLDNIRNTREILHILAARNYIMYMEDKTDNMYFMAAILRNTEKELKLEIKAILHFQNLVTGTKKSWVPIMKTYLALHFLQQPCTINDVCAATSLSIYKVRDCLKLLSDNNIILKQRIYTSGAPGEVFCLGQEIDINAFGIPS